MQCLDDGEMTVANDPLNKVPETMAHHQELVTVTQQTSPTDTLDPKVAHIKVHTLPDEGIETVH